MFVCGGCSDDVCCVCCVEMLCCVYVCDRRYVRSTVMFTGATSAADATRRGHSLLIPFYPYNT